MTSYFEKVRDFHIEILNVQDSAPHLLSPRDMGHRVAFMEEELAEMSESFVNGDITGVADALADLIYVALGTAHMMGLPMNQIFDAVHSANMRKVRGKTKRGVECDAAKPAGWVGPEDDITAAIYAEC